MPFTVAARYATGAALIRATGATWCCLFCVVLFAVIWLETCRSVLTHWRAERRCVFDQTERLFAVLHASVAGRLSAEAGLRELRRIVRDTAHPSAGAVAFWRLLPAWRVGLCLRQNPGLVEFIAALALSIPGGDALLIGMPNDWVA